MKDSEGGRVLSLLHLHIRLLGDTRPGSLADEERQAYVEARAVVAELIEAAGALLKHRVGEYPREGYLRDNDSSRADIDALATALSRVQS